MVNRGHRQFGSPPTGLPRGGSKSSEPELLRNSMTGLSIPSRLRESGRTYRTIQFSKNRACRRQSRHAKKISKTAYGKPERRRVIVNHSGKITSQKELSAP